MGIIEADTGNDPAAPDPLPPEGAVSTDPAALPAAEEAIDSAINEGAHEAADAPIPAPAIPLHPVAAAIVPMRDDASIRASARHIGPNDPIDPIILYEGKILDRWDLYLTYLLAKREPTFETYAGDDPLGFLIDRQLNRGYLNESQRAILGARVCELTVGGNQYSEGTSIGRASELLNVSPESISRAKKVLARGIPELVKTLDNGTLSIWKAFGIAKLPESGQRAALDGCKPPAVEGENSCSLPSGASEAQVETSASGNAVGSVDAEVPAGDAPQAGQPASELPLSASPTSVPGTTSTAVLESPRATHRYESGDWILHGDSPVPGVVAVVGSINAATTLVAAKAVVMSSGHVFWLTAQRDVRATLRPLFDAVGRWQCIQFLEARRDDYGLPIHHLRADLHYLENAISTTSNVRLAVVDYLTPYLACGDLEQSIRTLRRAFAEIYEIAMKHAIGVVVPCRLPCNSGSSDIAKAIDALAAIPELQGLLFVKGTDRGTIVVKKGLTGCHASAVDFRTNKYGCFEGSVPPIVLLENGVAPKRPKITKPYTPRRGRRGRLSNIRP
jgi:hypothetical protein